MTAKKPKPKPKRQPNPERGSQSQASRTWRRYAIVDEHGNLVHAGYRKLLPQ